MLYSCTHMATVDVKELIHWIQQHNDREWCRHHMTTITPAPNQRIPISSAAYPPHCISSVSLLILSPHLTLE